MPPLKPSRRQLLQVGSGLAGVGLQACFRTPDETVVPYASQPPELTPGVPVGYATGWSLGGHALGLVVQTYEGRPTRIEGNPDHPWSLGATGAIEQAEIAQLCDDSRLRTGRVGDQMEAVPELMARIAAHAAELERRGGEGLWFLHEADASPILAHLRERARRRFPQARWVEWSAVGEDNALEGAQWAFGERVTTVPRFERVRVGVFLDADPLGWPTGQVRNARALADRRMPGEAQSRLFCAEATLTVTGMYCDHRLPIRSARIPLLLFGLVRALSGRGVGGLEGLGPAQVELRDDERRWVESVAAELAANRGTGALLVGPRQPPLSHAIAHAVNEGLGNTGETLVHHPSPSLARPEAAGLTELVEAARQGRVETLVITAWNPVYTAPADLELRQALRSVPLSLYHAYRADQTTEAAHWVIPLAHPLESWGDVRSADGAAALVQPVTRPLFAGMSPLELWATFAGSADRPAREQLQDFWRRGDGDPQFKETFTAWLAEGVIPGSEQQPVEVTVEAEGLRRRVEAWRPPPESTLELEFIPGSAVFDGRYCANPLLQELPDPVTKVTWDNVALISRATADALGVQTGQQVELSLEGRAVEAPVFVLPGQVDGVVTVALGYGLRGPDRFTDGEVGFDAYRLRTRRALWFADGLVVTPRDHRYPLAVTQEHGRMHGRDLAIERTQDAWAQDVHQLERRRGPVEKLYPPWPTDEDAYAWAMTIDLARCTGCSACVLACQTENNVPVVGKDQVRRGREMHWLRVDRYFVGDERSPLAIPQPLMCVHCEQAPCEYVCPVNATVHSPEGLNQQVYNRCIGTRYCSNNCPYKVRRFNFLSYNRDDRPIDAIHKNPDVTVRSRGVMEKCTYCIQRIQRARITSRIEGRRIGDEEVKTACQQVCPTQAIVFGDLHNPNAALERTWNDLRAYALLHELGTQPRTRHLARIRNPVPAPSDGEGPP